MKGPPQAKTYFVSGLIHQLSCGLREAYTNASTPSVRADSMAHLAVHRPVVDFNGSPLFLV